MRIIPSSKLKNWLIEHDNKILFVSLYAGLSLVLTLLLGLFWLFLIVFIHLVFEIISHSYKKSNWRYIALHSIWETKLDFGLVLLALFICVYLDEILGMAGLGAVARTGTQFASRGVRFLSYQRIIRAIILSLDEMAIAVKAIFSRQKLVNKSKKDRLKKISEQNPPEHLSEIEKAAFIIPDSEVKNHTPWKSKWGFGDYFGVSLFAVCLVLIILAPLFLESYANWNDLFISISKEFHPFAYIIGN